MTPASKLGTLLPSGEEAEYRYPGCWDVEKTTGPGRLAKRLSRETTKAWNGALPDRPESRL
jgi:hypothetical protein